MDIKHIIIKSAFAPLTEEEQSQLDAWLRESEHNQRVYDHVVSLLGSEDDVVKRMSEIDVETALSKVKDKEIHKKHTQSLDIKKTFNLRSVFRYSAAACIALVIGVGVYTYIDWTRVTPPEITAQIAEAIDQCEIANAQAVTDGKIAAPVIKQNVTKNTLASYKLDDESIDRLYDASDIKVNEGNEYWFTLEDGTLIHLNRGTRVIYPKHFDGSQRDVVIDGEAYFMVARDKSRPFTVHTILGDVKVYGTEFIVNTHCTGDKGETTEVVLVKGAVSVTPAGGGEAMMVPGQRAVMAEGSVSITVTDLAPYIAWNQGEFFFHEWPLKKIMGVVGHWYGLTPEFEDKEIEQIKFSGNFSHYDDIHPILEAIASVTGLEVKLTQTRIILSR